MQFTGIVASFMWDRPSSWSFQAPQHFHFTKLPTGYIYLFSVLELHELWTASVVTQGAQSLHLSRKSCRIFMKRLRWHMQEEKMVDVQKGTNTLKIQEAKKVIFKTLRVNNTQRGQTQGPQLQWSYPPVSDACGGSECLRSSSLPGFVHCNDCKHRDGGFEKLLSWRSTILTGMPLLSVATS